MLQPTLFSIATRGQISYRTVKLTVYVFVFLKLLSFYIICESTGRFVWETLHKVNGFTANNNGYYKLKVEKYDFILFVYDIGKSCVSTGAL